MDNQYPTWWNETEEELKKKTLNQMDKKWDKREGSFIYDSLAAYVKLRALGREELKETLLMYFVDNAVGEILDNVVQTRSPLTRFLEKYATGIVKIVGNPNTKIPTDTRYMSIVYSDEQEPIEYVQIDNIVIDRTGVAYAKVQCLTPGQSGNIPANTIEIASPIVGVATVTNENKFENGADREEDDTFRDRYKRWLRENGSSGNISDYIRWSLEIDGVGSVVVIPIWAGRGTVKLIYVDQDFKSAGDEVILAAKEYICPVLEEGRGKAPIGATVTFESAEEIDVSLEAEVILKENANITDVQMLFQEQALVYLRQLNETGWEPSIYPKHYILNYLKAGALLVETNGVFSVQEMLLNKGVANLEAEPGQVFILKDVIIREYRQT